MLIKLNHLRFVHFHLLKTQETVDQKLAGCLVRLGC